jgi:UDP-glucose 4-epimerase
LATTRGVTPTDRAGKERAMRVIVIGASGNVGTSVLRSLENEDQVESILGLARRLPLLRMRKVEWSAADVTKHDLVPHLRGADAVVLLSWLKQPSSDLNKLWMNNVEGSMRAAGAVKEAGFPVLLYASSIGTYSPAPKDRAVDESWPMDGIPTLYYSRQKAEVERWLYLTFSSPNMDTSRARQELGWMPQRSAEDAFLELLAGPREGAGLDPPPLSPKTAGPLRSREIVAGVGRREP